MANTRLLLIDFEGSSETAYRRIQDFLRAHRSADSNAVDPARPAVTAFEVDDAQSAKLYEILGVVTPVSNDRMGSRSGQEAPPGLEVFFSYSHRDEKLRDELEKHLSALKRSKAIRVWHDRRITPGTHIDHTIARELERSDLVLLLVSADFLASEYCYTREMTKAMERHNLGCARVIPVILRPVDWHTSPFGQLMALPKDARPVTQWGRRDAAFFDIAQGVRRAAEELYSARFK